MEKICGWVKDHGTNTHSHSFIHAFTHAPISTNLQFLPTGNCQLLTILTLYLFYPYTLPIRRLGYHLPEMPDRYE